MEYPVRAVGPTASSAPEALADGNHDGGQQRRAVGGEQVVEGPADPIGP